MVLKPMICKSRLASHIEYAFLNNTVPDSITSIIKEAQANQNPGSHCSFAKNNIETSPQKAGSKVVFINESLTGAYSLRDRYRILYPEYKRSSLIPFPNQLMKILI